MRASPCSRFSVSDHDADVVEDAKARGVRAPGVVQSRDRHEGAPSTSVHQGFRGDECRADDVAGSLEDALERGRVTAVEVSLARRRARDDELHVAGIVKALELRPGGAAWRELQHLAVEALGHEFAPEGVVPVRAERMAVGKAVAGDALAGDDAGGRSASYCHAMPPRFEGAVPSLARLAAGARIADNPRPPRSPGQAWPNTFIR